MSDNNQLYAMRHSLAHIMATAVTTLWPEAKLGVGPVVENGFYYDIDIPGVTISTDDFKKIEKQMYKVINQKQDFVRSEKSIDQALKWADKAGQPYKTELLNDLKRSGTTVAKDLDADELGTISDGSSAVENVSFYTNGEFTDLCRGPHVGNTNEVGAFKLMRVAGAYWRGKEGNPQMQRLHGVAFATKEELKKHLLMLEEAKKRDHRVLGERLKLFFMSESVGAGLPLLMPRGEKVKSILMNYMRDKEEARGYQYVSTPVLTQRKLYERSGHAEYYLDDMYATEKDDEGNQFFLKPMNCPHHHMIFEKIVESYRDLPLRLSEHAGLYRYELSGTLTGLIRMRGPITQNDSHTYVTEDQLKSEFIDLLKLFSEVYRETNVKNYWFRLSLPDFSKGKYAGDKKKWEWAAAEIRDCLKQTKSDFVEVLDEAAFYGPKLDVQTKNVTGNEDTVATVQVDILVPERMGITYVDSDATKQYPIVIHKSIMGAFERFMAFLIEQTAGNFPVWLAPEQLRIIQVKDSDEIDAFVDEVAILCRESSVRIEIDRSNESVGKKIRNAELMKVPYSIVVGEKELETKQVTPRVRTDLAVEGRVEKTYPLENFIASIVHEAKGRVQKSSL
jgi:threonyl-tRNA synthetase